MIDLAAWLREAHEDVEDCGCGVYRHVFRPPFAGVPLIDHMTLTLKPGYPPIWDILYNGGVTVEIVRRHHLPRKLRKCHMRKIVQRQQQERRRYGRYV